MKQVPIIPTPVFNTLPEEVCPPRRGIRLSCGSFDQIYDRVNGVLLRRILHSIYVGAAVFIQMYDGIQKYLIGKFFFFEYDAVALPFKRTGIEDLIAAACIGR